MNSQPTIPSPLPSQPEQIEHNLAGSNSIEDYLELQPPKFSIAIEDGADQDDSFQLAPPRLSMPSDEGEQTARSIEIGRRGLDDQPTGRPSRGSFETIRGSDRSDDLSELGSNDVLQPSFDDSVLQVAPDADEEDLTVLGGNESLGSEVIPKGELRRRLTQHSGETEDLQCAMYKDSNCREDHLSATQQARELKGGVHSPFILNIPGFQSGRSSAEATYPDYQQVGGFDEEHEQSLLLLNGRPTKPNATVKAGRKAPKLIKKSRDGVSYPSFPAGITKKIASTFARSLGSNTRTIDKETLDAIIEATDQYFAQLSNDLGVFANHARRKKIDESDVIAVMRR